MSFLFEPAECRLDHAEALPVAALLLPFAV